MYEYYQLKINCQSINQSINRLVPNGAEVLKLKKLNLDPEHKLSVLESEEKLQELDVCGLCVQFK